MLKAFGANQQRISMPYRWSAAKFCCLICQAVPHLAVSGLSSEITEETANQLRCAQSLTGQAVSRICERIVRSGFEPGAPLSDMFAAELGVSKTPVRETLSWLRGEWLVMVQPQRGRFVFDMDNQEILELCELRETLELVAPKLAARRDAADLVATLRTLVAGIRAALDCDDIVGGLMLDGDFHRALIDHCGNRFL